MKLKLIGGRRIDSPKTTFTRPTSLLVREALFNILGTTCSDSNWLDLFSGSGAIACEAYNHGAKKIVAIEKNRKNAAVCFNNLLSLEFAANRKNDFEVICKDVISWIKPSNKLINLSKVINLEKYKFDFIYLDPPYKMENYDLVLEQIFKSNFIKSDTLVICEHSKRKLIKECKIYKVEDTRIYGQTKLSFLVKV